LVDIAYIKLRLNNRYRWSIFASLRSSSSLVPLSFPTFSFSATFFPNIANALLAIGIFTYNLLHGLLVVLGCFVQTVLLSAWF
jgi:hypothetical protein